MRRVAEMHQRETNPTDRVALGLAIAALSAVGEVMEAAFSPDDLIASPLAAPKKPDA